MDGNTPANIAGVFAFPNDEGGREIRFVDSSFQQLFMLPDRANIILTDLGGARSVLPCQYIDDYHARIGNETFHILQFAELQEKRGAVYVPEHPNSVDICDSYELYQIRDMACTDYAFRPYEEAMGQFHPSHYQRVYAAVLGPGVLLNDLFEKHNRDDRPFGDRIHSMSMSDVVVIQRGGKRNAYYVDRFDFKEVKQFLRPRRQSKKRPEQGR